MEERHDISDVDQLSALFARPFRRKLIDGVTWPSKVKEKGEGGLKPKSRECRIWQKGALGFFPYAN
jgi:hypothetical protein